MTDEIRQAFADVDSMFRALEHANPASDRRESVRATRMLIGQWAKLALAFNARPRVIVAECDEQDYDAICAAIARRQSWGVMPDDGDAPGGNATGRVLAEICRGWAEMLDAAKQS